MRTRLLAHALALCVGLAVIGSGPAIAGEPEQARHEPQAQMRQGNQTKGQMHMGQMKMQGPNMQEMVARQKANTERINALMTRVNTTSGDEKMAAMADVIAILVEERAAMQEHCAAMHEAMQK